MFTRDPGAPFDTPNAAIGSQGRNELTLSFRPPPYLHRLLWYIELHRILVPMLTGYVASTQRIVSPVGRY